MKKKKWLIAEQNDACAEKLHEELGITQLTARVLSARGIDCCEKAMQFMGKAPEHIHDPFLLQDMDKATEEIEAAIKNGVKIAVYGDYDVDGVTATCTLIKYLRKRGADCTYYIPDRLGEGYGLNTSAIQSLYDCGCRLLITVDSGITALEEIEYANSLGMRVIITDHHECKDELPNAVAVINPRREGSRYPFRELAGVGVAFKLVCALEKDTPVKELLEEFSDIVAVGTIADVMPLTGENRSIVSFGLEQLQNTKNYGLRALMQKLGLTSKVVTSNSVSFVMAPRINAAGRLGGASSAAHMFLTEDAEEAAKLAEHLCTLNRQRQEEENGIYEQIMEMLKNNPELTAGRTMTIWGDNWHNGVIGIVSSRLSDRYGLPCVLVSLTGDSGKGSGRSIKGFNLYAALEKNAHLLEKYGGHELAVGLSIDRKNLPAFRDALEEYARSVENSEEIVPCIQIDCIVSGNDMNIKDVQGLAVMEPFGMGNSQPIFAMYDVKIEEITPISHDRHVKLHLSKDGREVCGLVFGMGAKSCPFVTGDMVDIAFAAEINTYRGVDSVQLVIKDIRWSEAEVRHDAACYDIYQRFSGKEEINREEALILVPTKSDLVSIFRHIMANAENHTLSTQLRTVYRKVRYESRCNMNLGRFLVCLDVCCEFDIFSYELSGDDIVIKVLDHEGKADINGSAILKRLMEFLKR